MTIPPRKISQPGQSYPLTLTNAQRLKSRACPMFWEIINSTYVYL